jgi:hypothetical protein
VLPLCCTVRVLHSRCCSLIAIVLWHFVVCCHHTGGCVYGLFMTWLMQQGVTLLGFIPRTGHVPG